MDKRGKILGWAGLVGGGIASVGANVRSLWLPERGDLSATAWRALQEKGPDDAGAFVLAVFLPLAALVGVEMVQQWKHLAGWLRYGILGMVTAAAMLSSFVHIFTVFMWYGQSPFLATLGTLAIDGIMILSGLALFTTVRRPDTDTLDTDTRRAVAVSDTDSVWVPDSLADMSSPGQPDTDSLDNGQSDNAPDSLDNGQSDETPDNGQSEGRKIPAPRRARPDTAWMVTARACILSGEPESDGKIAEKILADAPGTWPSVEAGRKAVSRLRKAMAESA